MKHKLAATAALITLGIGTLAGCSSAVAAEPTPTPTSTTVKTSTALQVAARACIYQGIEVLDDGAALYFDMEGEDSDSGTGTWDDYECLLDELGAPESLAMKMGDTSANDGKQTDEFDGFEITWSYHPDNGLDFIVEEID